MASSTTTIARGPELLVAGINNHRAVNPALDVEIGHRSGRAAVHEHAWCVDRLFEFQRRAWRRWSVPARVDLERVRIEAMRRRAFVMHVEGDGVPLARFDGRARDVAVCTPTRRRSGPCRGPRWRSRRRRDRRSLSVVPRTSSAGRLQLACFSWQAEDLTSPMAGFHRRRVLGKTRRRSGRAICGAW